MKSKMLQDLCVNNIREVQKKGFTILKKGFIVGNHTYMDTKWSKWIKAASGAACIGHNVNVRHVLLLIDTNNKHGGILAGSRDDDLLTTTL